MRIDELWHELENVSDEVRARTDAKPKTWALRLAKPDPACQLHVGLELATRRRGLLLRIDRRLLPGKRQWPACRGLEVLAVSENHSDVLFGVALKDSRQSDVFIVLAEDLARRVTNANTPATRISALLGGLARWQKFLAASLDGLSEEQQRGLWGELYFLREHLLPTIGASAVNGWKGGERAHQDFQFSTGAVEVKTTLAKQPQTVRITSERQLDAKRWAVLFLYVLALDVRETKETLPMMVALVRSALSEAAAALERFEEELLDYGYLDAHASRYSGRGYVVRSSKFFRVGAKFPCLVEEDLPAGIGDVNYALSVGACERFKVISSAVVTALRASPMKGRGYKR